MTKPILEIKQLNIEFHDQTLPERVLHDFNLDLYPGEIVGLVGASGSGKTICGLAIAGLLNRKDMQKSGEILYGGHNLLFCPRDILRRFQGKEIGIIFQEPMSALNPVRKIGWQVEEGLMLHTDLSRDERYDRVINMLREVELDNPERIYRQYPHELSGGMRQRVLIAMAMICEPKILIADEITTALDVHTQAQIVNLIKRINAKRQTAIIFISHDAELIETVCSRYIVIPDISEA